MSSQRHATLVAAASLGLSLVPLASVFSGIGWTIPVMLTIGAVAGAGTLIRSLGRGQGLQTLGMSAALVLLLTMFFNGGTAIAFIIPTPATFGYMLDLVSTGIEDIVYLTPPVAGEGGILFLTMFGVGLVAILHDMFVVGLRTPALSGLTLLTMYLVPVSVSPDATAWFWFIFPAAAYLWVLGDDHLRRLARFGHRFTGSGTLVTERYPSPLAGTARLSGVLFITVALILLAVIPANTSGLLDRVSEGNGGSGDGEGDQNAGRVDPWAQLSGELRRPDPVELLSITTDNPTPGYLRMHVAEQLTNDGFIPVLDETDLEPLDSLDAPGGEAFRAQVENLAMTDYAVPVYGRPVGADLDDSWGVNSDTEVITSRESDLSDVDEYSFEYVEAEFDASLLRQAPALAADDPLRVFNTATPEEIPMLANIVDEAFDGTETDFDRVLAALDYLSVDNGFRYSLSPTEGNTGYPIIDFLAGGQEGYCQQFAGAMGWMLREAGVPARVVIGLTRGSKSGDSWKVDSNNYHAWVEVYFDGYGWVPFDPTPSSSVSNSVYFPWAADPDEQSSATGQNEPGATNETDPNQAETAPPTDELDPLDELGGAAPAGEQAGSGPHPAWLALIAVLILPLIPALWRVVQRRTRLGRDRVGAQAAWDETLDLAADYRLPLADSLTPRQTAARLGEAAPPAREAALALAGAVEHHRYARDGATDASFLPRAVRELHASLDHSADPRTRMRARLWPPPMASQLLERRRRTAAALGRLRLRWPLRSNSRRDEDVGDRP